MLVLCLLPVRVMAGRGEIRFVETAVDLRTDGQAVVAYTVQWRVLEGKLHGFYFSGNERLRVEMAVDRSYAVDSRGNRYGLSVDKVGSDKWGIVLAKGKGIESGSVTYVFPFQTDFAAAGYMVSTRADDGKDLVVFNWSPVRWDEARNQDHYTFTILTPNQLPPGADPRGYVLEKDLVLTEPFVNERFKIDYQRGERDRLRLIFHRENPGNRFDMRVEIYMPAAWFSLPTQTAESDRSVSHTYAPLKGSETPWYERQTPIFGIGGIFLLAIFLAVVFGKHRSMIRAHHGLSGIKWENLDWTPPKLILSSFRKSGKICNGACPIYWRELGYQELESRESIKFEEETDVKFKVDIGASSRFSGPLRSGCSQFCARNALPLLLCRSGFKEESRFTESV